MNSSTEDDEQSDDPVAVSAGQYVAFIQQLQLERIWLKSAKVTNSSGGSTPQSASVMLNESHGWNDLETGFLVSHKYIADFRNDKNRKLAKVDVEFGLSYRSEEPMTDDIFAIFSENNLPLNSWPYFREYLSSTVSRMGWLAFTLPARKIPGNLSRRDQAE